MATRSFGRQRSIANRLISSSKGRITSAISPTSARSIRPPWKIIGPRTSSDPSTSGRTVAPSPCRTVTSPKPSSTLMASRTEVRFTRNSAASSRSGGSFVPARKRPSRIASRSCSATSSWRRRRAGARKGTTDMRSTYPMVQPIVNCLPGASHHVLRGARPRHPVPGRDRRGGSGGRRTARERHLPRARHHHESAPARRRDQRVGPTRPRPRPEKR